MQLCLVVLGFFFLNKRLCKLNIIVHMDESPPFSTQNDQMFKWWISQTQRDVPGAPRIKKINKNMWLCQGSPCSQWKFSRNSIGKTTQSSARLGFCSKVPRRGRVYFFSLSKAAKSTTAQRDQDSLWAVVYLCACYVCLPLSTAS